MVSIANRPHLLSFLSIFHATRSGSCVVVIKRNTNLDSKLAETTQDRPHLLSSTLEVLDAVKSSFYSFL